MLPFCRNFSVGIYRERIQHEKPLRVYIERTQKQMKRGRDRFPAICDLWPIICLSSDTLLIAIGRDLNPFFCEFSQNQYIGIHLIECSSIVWKWGWMSFVFFDQWAWLQNNDNWFWDMFKQVLMRHSCKIKLKLKKKKYCGPYQNI